MAKDPDRLQRPCTEDFITELFCRVDGAMAGERRHPLASLWPGEVVTLALLFAIRGGPGRAFYRWARRDLRPLFPGLPDRTRLFRLFAAHAAWAQRFLAAPTFFGVADSYGIELLQTARPGRSPRQIARRGRCGRRWIAGVKLGPVVNHDGRVCAWGVDTAERYDADAFNHLIEAFDGEMIVLADCNFHKSPFHRKADPADRDPPNLKVCPRGRRDERELIETVLSMLTRVCSLKRLTERAWPYLKARLGFVAAAFNLLTEWDGRPRLAIARFSI